MTGPLMRAEDVAELLDISLYRVKHDREIGLLPFRRSGRLIRHTQEDVDTYLERMKVDAAGATGSGQTAASLRRRRAS